MLNVDWYNNFITLSIIYSCSFGHFVQSRKLQFMTEKVLSKARSYYEILDQAFGRLHLQRRNIQGAVPAPNAVLATNEYSIK